jgi:cytochrome P450
MCDEVVSMPIADVPVSDVDLWSVTNLKEPHERFIADRASELVEEVMGRGSIDAVCELGEPFSTRVVGNLVGLPREGRDRLIHLANQGFDIWGPPGERVERGWPGFRSLHDYGHRVADEDLLAPGRWGTQIFEAGQRGDVEPEAWDRLRADRSLMTSALNEVLRYYSPVQRYSHLVTEPTEIGGVDVPTDSRVLVLIGSANRDERRYERPDEFDVTRNPRNHLGFGRRVHTRARIPRCRPGGGLSPTESPPLPTVSPPIGGAAHRCRRPLPSRILGAHFSMRDSRVAACLAPEK